MKMKSIKYFSLILVFLSTNLVFSQEEETLGNIVSGATILSTTMSVIDPLFSDVNTSSFMSNNSAVSLFLGFNDEVSVASLANLNAYNFYYKAEVTVQIKRYSVVTTTAPNPAIETKIFTIEHNNLENKINTDFVLYRMNETHKVEATITNIVYRDLLGVAISVPNSTLFGQLKFNVERYYNLKETSLIPKVELINYNNSNPISPLLGDLKAGNAQEIRISWTLSTPARPATEYELEWTWVDSYFSTQSQFTDDDILLSEKDFKSNCTRVQTKSSFYNIPLIFNKGYIVYRVRPIGRFLDKDSENKVYNGSWTSDKVLNKNFVIDWPDKICIDIAHEGGKKNWQYQSSFAENGKKKEVVSYFDGSLRNRQTVTKINTNQKVVVGEVIYDNQGRPAIEVLPVPVDGSAIKYFNNLNTIGNSIYSHNDFDWDKSGVAALKCAPNTIPGMEPTTGASKYYGSQSTLSNNFQDFVPDAFKYPFSQIEYTPDNTGRIRRKGGVGKTHQIGTGQEMSYFYDVASQEELNRLFGYKVGFANRYKKNTVIDPNKQVSVSYLDPKGKTIATALTGGTPTNLVGLEDEQSTTLHKNVKADLFPLNTKITTGQFGVIEDGLEVNSQIGVEKQNDKLTFEYKLSHLTNSFTKACLNSKSYPFVYDLSFKFKDDCGFDKVTPVDNFRIGSINTNNNILNLPLVDYKLDNDSFLQTEPLNPGTYSLSKKLSVNLEAANAYADDYINTLKNSTNPACNESLIVPVNIGISMNDCIVTCNSCEWALMKSLLNAQDADDFQDLFTLGQAPTLYVPDSNLSIYNGYLINAEEKFVSNKLAEQFPDYTFTYSGSNYISTPAAPAIEGLDIYANNYVQAFKNAVKVCKTLCPSVLETCDVNEKTMLKDLSPRGQYGSIEGIVAVNTDPEPTTDDEDPLGTEADDSDLKFSVSNMNVIEGQSASFIVSLNRTSPTGILFTANITTSGTTTTSDFTALTPTQTQFTIAPNSLTWTITIPTILDTDADNGETFKLNVNSGFVGFVTANSSAFGICTINDNNAVSPTFSSLQQTVTSETSVFNEYNRLLIAGTYPIGFNSNPTVRLEQSRASWKYPVTKYLNEDGSDSKITVTKIGIDSVGKALYSPTVEPNLIQFDPLNPLATQVHFIPTDDENKFLVNPEYIDDIAVFLNAWQPTWANSLLKYHPEYQYLVYNTAICEKTNTIGQNSAQFDKNLKDIDLKDSNQAVSNDAKIAAFLNDLYAASTPTFTDPFYNSGLNSTIESPATFLLRKNLMTEALKNYEGMKHNNLALNMLQAAYYSVLSGNGLISNANLTSLFNNSNSILISNLRYNTNPSILSDAQKIRVWQTFLNYYMSFKEKTKTVFSNIYANKNSGYNGCIGDALNTDNYITLFNKYTLFSNVLALITASTSAPSFPNIPTTVTSVVTSSGSRFAPCSPTTYRFFAAKDKRFISADYGYNSGITDAQSQQNAELDSNTQMYYQTGKCPLLLDIELLLNGLINKDYNPADSLQFPAINASSITPFTTDLFKKMGGTFPIASSTNPTIKGEISGSLLNIIVHYGNDNLQPITLKTLAVTPYDSPCSSVPVPFPDFSNYNATDYKITKFKEIFFVSEINGINTFRIKAIIQRLISNTSVDCFEEVIIEGTTKVDLNKCSFAPGGELSNSTETEAGAGCFNKTNFEKNLVIVLNKLKSVLPNKLISNLPVSLKGGASINATTGLIIPGIYGYDSGYIAEFFGDSALTATYNANANGNILSGFSININGAIPMTVMLQQPTSVDVSKINKFTGIEINGTTITVFYLSTANTILSIKGTIGKVVDSEPIKPIDFKCLCTKRIPVKQAAEEALLALINHLWTVQKANGGNIPNGYNPQEYQNMQAYTNVDLSDGIQEYSSLGSEVSNPNLNSGANGAMYFQITRRGDAICSLNFTINNQCQNSSNLFEAITHFSSLSLVDGATFKIVAEHGIYGKTSDNCNWSPAHNDPAITLLGRLPCLNLTCTAQNTQANTLQTLLNQVVTKYKSDLILQTADGLTSTALNNLQLNDVSLPRVIKNFSAVNNSSGSSFTCNLNENSTCNLTVKFPIGTTLQTVQSIYSIKFTDNLNFTANFTTASGTFKCSGKIDCFKFDDCSKEVTTECQTCIPEAVEPVNCISQRTKFLNGMLQVTDYVAPLSFTQNHNYFCDANYGYISTQYLYYLSKLGINSKLHPRFITIAEFGATKLNYGYAQMNTVVNAYKDYLGTANDPTKLDWADYVNTIYTTGKIVCPPAPLVPNIPEVSLQGLPTPCQVFSTAVNATYSQLITQQSYEQKREIFIKEYVNEALNKVQETFTKEEFDKEYQYTLYYYDQAGNLVQTIPPQGVNRLGVGLAEDVIKAKNDLINSVRIDPTISTTVLEGLTSPSGAVIAPSNSLQTKYRYNSLNQLVWQTTPDGGETRFAYDKLGRIIASQNAKQKVLSFGTTSFSYTKYDGLGRIFEAGEILIPQVGTVFSIDDNGKLLKNGSSLPTDESFFEKDITPLYNKREVTRTIYDNPHKNAAVLFDGDYSEDNAQKRVTGVLYFDGPKIAINNNDVNYNNAIFYDYDVHGNVKQLVNQNKNPNLYANQTVKRIVYDYDLISGNVNKVTFQPNRKDEPIKPDLFIHKYTYDADNRITDVYTSTDNAIWEKDANYQYYDHGPLARLEIGDKKVQGLDYIYTLQGWLKSVNSEKLGKSSDPGKDGQIVAQDAFGFALNYYSGDYKSRNNVLNNNVDANKTYNFSKGLAFEGIKNLYNGNIKEMTTSLIDLTQKNINTQFNSYTYDQLNRIKSMDSRPVLYDVDFQDEFDANAAYKSAKENYSFDRNGNLTFLNRWKQSEVATAATTTTPYLPVGAAFKSMDELAYTYDTTNGRANRLNNVKDNQTDINVDLYDLEGTSTYNYDQIGQLTTDLNNKVADIRWRVDGKVKSVRKTDNSLISFEYDGLGNRISKTFTTATNSETTFYQRDAQGNVLSTYVMKQNGTGPKEFRLIEQDIYGSSRLGIQSPDKVILQNASRGAIATVENYVSDENFVFRPPSAPTVGGLTFDNINDHTGWNNPNNNINFLDNGIEKTEHIEISAQFKITDSATQPPGLLGALTTLVGNDRTGNIPDDGWFYRSSARVLVEKTASGSYKPIVKILTYQRNHWKGRDGETWYDNGEGWNRYSNYTDETTYTIPVAIPEKEWDFRTTIDLVNGSYKVIFYVNGNVYDAVAAGNKHQTGEQVQTWDGDGNDDYMLDLPYEASTMGAGWLRLSPGINFGANALKAQVCDFSYTVDDFKNTFNFDNNSLASVTTDTTDEDEVLPSFSMGNAGVDFGYSYCGAANLDSDLDGIPDYDSAGNKKDNCTFTFNPNQLDTDNNGLGDGFGDVCDNCKTIKNGLAENQVYQNGYQYDVDNDGVGDVCDNCKFVSNHNQSNGDADTFGDACDNCRTITNQDQADGDKDGIGNDCEGLDQQQGSPVLEVPLVAGAVFGKEYLRIVGDKKYELSNHLGNVLSVITDKKLWIAKNVSEITDTELTFMPDVIAYNDYYPFGSLVPGRHGNSASYRYGFNGKENDNELKGEGNSLDFGARMYDSRIGRWFARDPKESKYPNLSPYNSFENNPIVFIDPDGEDAVVTISGNTMTVKAIIYVDNSGKNKIDVVKAQKAIMKVWGGNHKDSSGKYNVKFDIQVREKPVTTVVMSVLMPNQPKLGEVGAENFVTPNSKGYRSNVKDYKYGDWAIDPSPIEYGHEVGHLLGLADRYVDTVRDPMRPEGKLVGVTINTMTDAENEEYYRTAPVTSTKVDGKNSDDLMENSVNGKVSQKSIDAIVNFALETQKNGSAVINTNTLNNNGKGTGLAAPTAVESINTQGKAKTGGNVLVPSEYNR